MSEDMPAREERDRLHQRVFPLGPPTANGGLLFDILAYVLRMALSTVTKPSA